MVAATSLALLAAIAGGGQAEIIAFSGPGCPACVHMAPVVEQARQAGVPIRRVDIHEQPELVRQFGITAIPAFVLVSGGREVDRIVGGTTAQGLAQLYQRAIPPGATPAATSTSLPATSPVAPAIVRGQDTPALGVRPVTATATTNTNSNSNNDNHSVVPVRSNPARPDTGVATGSRARGVASPPVSAAAARALAATVRLKVVDAQGHAFGTGTIVDVHGDEALVVTCGHIFRSSQGKGQILCDLFVPGAPRAVAGKLISYDLRRDIGLVSLKPGVAVTPVPMGGLGYAPQKGNPVFAVGCNQGAEPTVIENRILDVNRYHGPPNLVVGGRPIDGRSGGGLFSADGMLIGVCNAADPELDEGLYAALGNIHAELDTANLAFIYRRSGAPSKDSPLATAAVPMVPLPTAAPVTNTATTPAPTHPAPSGATPEFVYIRWSQGNEDQVYMLERPSSEFLQSLSREINRRGPHLPTTSRSAERSTVEQ